MATMKFIAYFKMKGTETPFFIDYKQLTNILSIVRGTLKGSKTSNK